MKTSLIVSAILALLIGLAGWRNQQKGASYLAERKALEAEAERLGVSSDASRNPAGGASTAHRLRPDRETAAKTTAADMIAFAREMDAMTKNGGDPSDMGQFQERVLELMDRMTSLDANQLKALIGEFRNAADLSDEARQGLIAFSVLTLSKEQPRMALELFTETSDLFPDVNMNKHMISGALSEWAKTDPDAALEWVRTNKEKHSELISDDARRGLVSGIALNDPKRAFQLLDELLEVTSSEPRAAASISSIVHLAKTPAQRTATLEAFREYASSLPPGEARSMAAGIAFSSFAASAAGEAFEDARAWVDSAKLSPEELVNFASGLTHNSRSSDKGKWIGWISETLPAEKAGEQVRQIVRQWTSDDYKAAGDWLVSTPEGLVKTAAVQSYAETVAPYEPETAAQWAMTLPAGKERDLTLKNIHRRLEEKDATAAEAFAEKHGIK